jgi:hypothetical protein
VTVAQLIAMLESHCFVDKEIVFDGDEVAYTEMKVIPITEEGEEVGYTLTGYHPTEPKQLKLPFEEK